MNRIVLEDERDYLDWREGSGSTVEIFNVQVMSARRKGKGRLLVRKLFTELGPGVTVWAITRADNEVAIQWYQSLRFEPTGVLRRFYGVERGVDAILFSRRSEGPI